MIIGIDGNEANVENRVGSGKYAFEIIREFAKNGKDQFLIYLKDRPVSDLPKETTNFKYIVFGPKRLWTQLALPLKLTFGAKPDVFFSTAHYLPRFSPSNLPLVVTIHDLSFIHFPNLFKKKDLLQLTLGTKSSVQKAAHTITVSKNAKEDIAKTYNINPSKISVTYEGYDPIFKPQPKKRTLEVLSKYKISGDYVIFIGTLQPRKNIEGLIEVIPRLKVKNLKLVVVGKKGWLFGSIFEKVKKLNLEGKVTFTGYVPQNDLPALISGAKIYVLPSLWEGFGIPVIEAQGCGVPVVVSNTSSLPEIAEKSAILVDPQDVDSIKNGLEKVLTDKSLASSLVKNGFENIKRFSWEKCAQETLAILKKVAKKSQK